MNQHQQHTDNAARVAKLEAQRHRLRQTLDRLASQTDLTETEERQLELGLADFEQISAELTLAKNDARKALRDDPTVGRASGVGAVAPEQWHQSGERDAWESTDRAPSQRVGNAMRAMESSAAFAEKRWGLRSDISTAVRATIERNPQAADTILARGDPNYFKAWSKIMATGDPARASMILTDAERAAVARVEEEARAASEGTPSAGGYLVPIVIDPSIILQGTGATNPFRQYAHMVTAVSNQWRGVAAPSISAGYYVEGSVVGDDTPSLIQPVITAYRGTSFIPFSFELAQDVESFQDQCVVLFIDARNVLETSAFTTGSGTNMPWGIQTRFLSNTFNQVTSSTHGTIGIVDVHNTFASLPPRYRPNATWVGSAVTQNAIRASGDDRLGQLPGAGYAVGASLMPVAANGVDMMLLGHPWAESSGMPDLPTNSTANTGYLLVADIQKTYTIFDRLNTAQVEIVQHLLDPTTARPTGQRGFLYWWRGGADVNNSTGTGEMGGRLLMNKTS